MSTRAPASRSRKYGTRTSVSSNWSAVRITALTADEYDCDLVMRICISSSPWTLQHTRAIGPSLDDRGDAAGSGNPKGVGCAAREVPMLRLKLAVFILCSAAMSAGAADYTGYISDAKCAGQGKDGAQAHASCAVKCSQAGEAAVLAV